MSVCLLVIVAIMTQNLVANINATVIPTSKVLLRHYVSEGARARLKCPSVSPWMLCVWRSPNMERLCVLSMTGARDYRRLCSTTNKTVNNKTYLAFVSLHSCDLAFKVNPFLFFPPKRITCFRLVQRIMGRGAAC